ncbi:MAG: peroxidase-related enzyme [Proteobacteria bacterium]|nr:peroxidase-related enzyme [Pseudomonadota bacterium]
MARMDPLNKEDVPELEDFFAIFEQRMGFLPNSLLTMAHRPELVQAFAGLGKVIYTPTDNLPLRLRNMIAHIASRASGCLYCVAHTGSNTLKPGSDLEAESLEKLWEYETSDHFSERERAALRFAQAAAVVPNAVKDEHFQDLRQYFSELDIVDILSIISYFGYLNRWNDSMATTLEPIPTAIGDTHLGAGGWTPGKHK